MLQTKVILIYLGIIYYKEQKRCKGHWKANAFGSRVPYIFLSDKANIQAVTGFYAFLCISVQHQILFHKGSG